MRRRSVRRSVVGLAIAVVALVGWLRLRTPTVALNVACGFRVSVPSYCRGIVRSDLDGDRKVDQVWITAVPKRSAGQRVITAELHWILGAKPTMARSRSLGETSGGVVRLLEPVELNGYPGAEVLIERGSPPSQWTTADIYAVERDDLVNVTDADPTAPSKTIGSELTPTCVLAWRPTANGIVRSSADLTGLASPACADPPTIEVFVSPTKMATQPCTGSSQQACDERVRLPYALPPVAIGVDVITPATKDECSLHLGPWCAW
jgi:hypothetical protein